MPCERSKGAATLSVLPLMNIPRWRFVEVFEKDNSYSSALFPEYLIRAFPCPVACVQTEIGQKFKKQFSFCGSFDKSVILQIRLKKHGIRYKLKRLFTRRHNKKVERSHRKMNERFSSTHSFIPLEDLPNSLKCIITGIIITFL